MNIINTDELFFDQFITQIKETSNDQDKITKSTLNRMLADEELTLDKVEKNNASLSDKYSFLSALYGFDDFYSLYLYADSCELEGLSKGGNKDLSKLKKVKRTVTRNGKPTEMTFYEERDSEDSDIKLDGDKKEGGGATLASELESSITEGKGKKNTVTTQKLSQEFAELDGEGGKFQLNCRNYISFKDAEGNIRAVGGVKEVDEYLYLSFFKSDTAVQEAQIRAFYEVVKLAIVQELGVMFDIPEDKTVKDTYEFIGLEVKKDKYVMKYKELVLRFGKGE